MSWSSFWGQAELIEYFFFFIPGHLVKVNKLWNPYCVQGALKEWMKRGNKLPRHANMCLWFTHLLSGSHFVLMQTVYGHLICVTFDVLHVLVVYIKNLLHCITRPKLHNLTQRANNDAMSAFQKQSYSFNKSKLKHICTNHSLEGKDLRGVILELTSARRRRDRGTGGGSRYGLVYQTELPFYPSLLPALHSFLHPSHLLMNYS